MRLKQAYRIHWLSLLLVAAPTSAIASQRWNSETRVESAGSSGSYQSFAENGDADHPWFPRGLALDAHNGMSQEEYKALPLKPYSVQDSAWSVLVSKLREEEFREPRTQKQYKHSMMPGPFSTGALAWKIILFAVAVIILVFAIIRIAGLGMLRPNPRLPGADWEGAEEISPERPGSDFEEWLRKAVKANDYRMIIRIRFLLILKELHERGLISWKKEKTNAEYLRELPGPELRHRFGLISDLFTWTWYGEYPLTGQAFEKVEPLFDAFLQQLNQRRK